jgi:hypothetical protein
MPAPLGGLTAVSSRFESQITEVGVERRDCVYQLISCGGLQKQKRT